MKNTQIAYEGGNRRFPYQFFKNQIQKDQENKKAVSETMEETAHDALCFGIKIVVKRYGTDILYRDPVMC